MIQISVVNKAFEGGQSRLSGANAGIVLTTTDGRGNANVVEQNVLGWTTKTTDAAGNATTTAYDLAHGKPSCVTHRYAYDLHGNTVAEFGTGAQPVVFGYDDADNLVSQKLFRASSETIETDPRSRADGDETTWTYHAATGLLLSKTYPDASGIGYAYDAHNRLSSTTFSREVSAGTRLKVSRAYAELTGELVSVSYNDGTAGETHTYNHLGQVTRTVDASGTRAYVYNRYNEVESETLTGDGVAHAVTELRDAFGRGTGYAYAKAGTVQQTTGVSYAETTGRIATASFVHGGAQKTFSYAYLAGTSLVQTLTCPNNMTETRSYEAARNLLSGIAYKRGTTLVSQRTYVRDALGRPLTRSTARNGTTQNDAFGYNARSELTSATLGNDEYAYAFDNIGNRASSAEAGTQSAYSTNNLNQYASIGENEENAFVPGYDADGNATSIQTSTGTWSVEYNGANRPVRFRNEESDTTIECGYDSQGRRCFKKVTVAGTVTLHHRYIYRGYLQIACVDLTRSGHPALWFVLWDPSQETATRPLAIQKDGTWYTYGCDITKNVCEVFGPAGYIRTSYSYAPFGAVTASGDVTQPFQWSSEHYDSELDLVYYNYRHYSPDLGRFLSRDPIEEQGGVNLYAFTSNAPIVQIDILGKIVPAPGCHLNSPTCGGNGKVGIENPFPKSWQTALIDFLRWWNGTHPQESNYGPDSQETKDLMRSEIARRLREAFREKNQGRKCSDWKGLSGAGLKFGPIRFIKDIPNGRAHFVGSADGDVSIKIDSENCKVVATFVLENTTSLESFLYHLWFVENIEEPGLPRSNWVQRYTWQEEYECKKCDEEDL